MSVDIVSIGDKRLDYGNPSDDKFEPSVDAYWDLAKKTIGSFASKFSPGLSVRMLKSDDAISAIAHAIMMADWRWNPDYRSKDGKVRTRRSYRNQCAIWAIKSYLGRQCKQESLVSLNTPIGDFYEDNLSLGDITPSREKTPEVLALDKERSSMLEQAMDDSALTDQQKHYIESYYFDNCTLQQLANEAGSSREAVRQVISRALNKVKKRLKY